MGELTDAEFIEIMRKTYADLVRRPSGYSRNGRLNIACWLADRTKRMLAIIDAKQAENAALRERVAELEAALARLTPEPGTVLMPMPDPWGEEDEIYNNIGKEGGEE